MNIQEKSPAYKGEAGDAVLVGSASPAYSDFSSDRQGFAVPIGELINPIVERALRAMAANNSRGDQQ